MRRELNAMRDKEVWEEVTSLPLGTIPIPCMFMYKFKSDKSESTVPRQVIAHLKVLLSDLRARDNLPVTTYQDNHDCIIMGS